MAINYVSTQTANITTLTTVYNPTTSGVQATLLGCLLANTTTSTVTASVTLVNSGATVTTNIVKNVIIPTGTSLDIMNAAKIVVPQNYTVQVVASGATDVTVSSVEVS
jgi:hypothetical protein